MSNAPESAPQELAVVVSELRAAITRLEESDARKHARIAELEAELSSRALGVTLRTHETQKAVKSARSRSVFRTQPLLRIRHCFAGSWGHCGRNFSRKGV